jgi:hypothetical protein
MHGKKLIPVVVLLALWVWGCRGTAPASETPGPYVPGLGEIMSLQQMRHTKLWLAGQAGNWDLAAYELDELGEGFDDVVTYHPTHKDSPVAPKDAIPRMVTEPLAELRTAVEQKNGQAFAKAYDGLTTACNNCHEATNFGFNRVQRPESNPYPNQVFAPPPSAAMLSGDKLVQALRKGGYALVIRHASSPSQPPDRQSADPGNANLERQLDETGRSSAAAMGRALHDLKIPIGSVSTSPTYRARETARLAQLPNPKPQDELGDGGQSMKGVTAGQSDWLRDHVEDWPRGTNTAFVTQLPNIEGAFPQWASDLSDGETLVLGPDGSGGVRLVAQIPIDQWSKLPR